MNFLVYSFNAEWSLWYWSRIIIISHFSLRPLGALQLSAVLFTVRKYSDYYLLCNIACLPVGGAVGRFYNN